MRLIDADALLERLKTSRDCDTCEWECGGRCANPHIIVDVCEAIDEAPTVGGDEGEKWCPLGINKEDDKEILPSAQPEQRWIPCGERLPEPNLSVLVQLNDDFVDPIQIMTLDISKCEGDFFCFWRTQEMGINFDMDDVVAWMPLPEPWKREEDE